MTRHALLRIAGLFALAAVFGLCTGGPAYGQDLVYQPTNPAFGGSPLNYQWLLSSAQAQNLFEEDGRDPFLRDPLADFEQNLQRQILSQLSREIVGDRFGELDFTQEGRYDLGEFTVEITPGLDGIAIRVFNTLTGDESVITIPSF